MPAIEFTGSDGRATPVDYRPGRATLMQLGRDAGVAGIVGDCGGFLACATCHVHVAPEWLARVGPPSDEERALIAETDDPRPESRLGCQLWPGDEHDGLRVIAAG